VRETGMYVGWKVTECADADDIAGIQYFECFDCNKLWIARSD
jgi:hypothetical protein